MWVLFICYGAWMSGSTLKGDLVPCCIIIGLSVVYDPWIAKFLNLELLSIEMRRNGIFPKLLGLQGSKCTSEQWSRERKLRAHSRHLLIDPNGQILQKCSAKLQTKIREDPTVNKRWVAFLPRQLHVASWRSFIKRLPQEASSWLLWEAFSRGFYEKLML